MEQLLTPDQVAEALNVPRRWLYKARRYGYGPPAVKVGGLLRYRPSDIDAFIAAGSDPKP